MKHTLTFLLVLLASVAFGQLRVDNSEYFKQSTAKREFCDFSDIGQTWDGIQISAWAGLGLTGILHAYRPESGIYYSQEPRKTVNSTIFVDEVRYSPKGSPILIRKSVGVPLSDRIEAPIVLSCIFTIGCRTQPLKYKVANCLIGAGIRYAAEYGAKSLK